MTPNISGADLHFKITAPDNFAPSYVTDVASACTVYSDDPVDIVEACWYLINSWSKHELGEQFYVDGKLPYNEHNND